MILLLLAYFFNIIISNRAALAGLLLQHHQALDDPAALAGLLLQQHQALNDPAALAGLLNNWFDIEDYNLLRHEEVEMALEQEKVQLAIEEIMETDLSSSTEMVLPEDLSDPDSEVQPLTRMETLNSVNIGIEMVKRVLQMMAVLCEDEASHMLTRVYHKCLDLKTEKET